MRYTQEEVQHIITHYATTTNAELGRVLGVSLRQVTYQVSFRPKRKTLADMAKQVGITVDAVNKRKQKGMTNEQIVNHKKWARYKQLAA